MKAVPILLAAAVAAGAAQADAQGMSVNSAGAAAMKEVPFVKAETIKVDAVAGKVTLKHEHIPNLDMPGMTMVFPVASKTLLNGVKKGDHLRVKIEAVKGQAIVTALEATR